MTRSFQALPHSSHGKEEKPEISAGLWVQADTSEKEMELSQYKQHAWKSLVPAPQPALQQDSSPTTSVFTLTVFQSCFLLSPSLKVSRQLHVNFVTPLVLLILLQGWIIGCFKKQVFKQRLKAVLSKQGWKSTRNLAGREQKALSLA